MTTTPLVNQPALQSAHGTKINVRAVGGVLVTGMVAGMMMGMLQMIVEAVSGHGFWSPLRYIASVFTRGANTDPSFAFGPVVVGLGGHMVNSVILTTIFAAVFWKVRNPVVLAAAGMMWGALVYVFMWWVVIPTVDPAMQLVNAPWFFVAHVVFGMVAGLGVAATQRLTRTATSTTA